MRILPEAAVRAMRIRRDRTTVCPVFPHDRRETVAQARWPGMRGDETDMVGGTGIEPVTPAV